MASQMHPRQQRRLERLAVAPICCLDLRPVASTVATHSETVSGKTPPGVPSVMAPLPSLPGVDGVVAGYNIDMMIHEYHINGFVVFPNLVTGSKLETLRARFEWMNENVRRRDTTAMTGDRRDGQGRLTQVARYKVQIPWEQPWANPDIYEHPAVMQLLQRLWGTEDFELIDYSSNNPSPGATDQQWHRDSTPALVTGSTMPVYPQLSLRFPLVDTTVRQLIIF